jgi:pimeloyl-ACP methyl ester carboxylesterase
MKVLPKYLPLRTVRYLAKANHKRDFPRSPEEGRFWDAVIEEIASEMRREGNVGYYDTVIDYNLNYKFGTDDLASWGGDIIIFQSDNDRHIKPERQAELRELYPRAMTHMFHGTGRLPYLSQPEEFQRVLKSVLT